MKPTTWGKHDNNGLMTWVLLLFFLPLLTWFVYSHIGPLIEQWKTSSYVMTIGELSRDPVKPYLAHENDALILPYTYTEKGKIYNGKVIRHTALQEGGMRWFRFRIVTERNYHRERPGT